MTILVTGATGTIGSEVVRQLAKKGVEVRAASRTPKNASTAGASVLPVLFDFDDANAMNEAMNGVDRLFLLIPFSPAHVAQTRAVVSSAVRNGVRHVVKLSFIGAADGTLPTAVGAAHREAEQIVASAGLALTSLRPTSFMQNFLMYAAAIKTGTYAAPIGDARVAYVDTRDIAAVASTVLTEAGHEDKAYTLTGPAALTGAEVAELFAHTLAHDVRFASPSDEAALQRITGRGMPEWFARALVEMDVAKRSGDQAIVDDSIRLVTGRTPRTFADFIRDHIDAFK